MATTTNTLHFTDEFIRYLPILNVVAVGLFYYIKVLIAKDVKESSKVMEEKLEKERSWRIEDDKEIHKVLNEWKMKVSNNCNAVGRLEESVSIHQSICDKMQGGGH
jgi:hypothetical protein